MSAVTAPAGTTGEAIDIESVRSRLAAFIGLLLAAILTGIFAVAIGNYSSASFKLSWGTGVSQFWVVSYPATVVGLILAIAVLVLAIYHLAKGLGRTWKRAAFGIAFAVLLITFLGWVSTGSGNPFTVGGWLTSTLTYAVPLTLGALAGCLSERSGVINMAIEGEMLVGAFFGALFASVASSAGIGIVGAVLGGAAISALLAWFSVTYVVNQVILGVVLNVFALGLTGFLYDAFMKSGSEHYNSPPTLSQVRIPLLADIPIIGPAMFDVNVLYYATYVIVIVLAIWLTQTRWGLRTRSVGEHPLAADTLGIKVKLVRYRNVIIGGCLAGLAGAVLTVGGSGQFQKNMTSGRGYIALAAMIFGRWSPLGATSAAVFFGSLTALQDFLSSAGTPVNIPSNLLAMLPYLATIFAIAGLVGRVRMPAADGTPYVKE